jgi:alkylation response protein AidB-like acyl-CoA dehydrogenase
MFRLKFGRAMSHIVEYQQPARPGDRERALQQLLREARSRRAEFATNRRLSDDIVDLLREIGVFRSLVARRFGGNEDEPSRFYRLIETIAAADGSTGWVASFGHTAIYLAALPVKTLEAIYVSGPDVILAGGLFPPQPAQRVDGGFEVSGRWRWGSGCTAASLIGVGIWVDDDSSTGGLPRMAILPREQIDIVENWEVNGLRGTGSHDLVVNNVIVPEDWTFIRGSSSTLGTPLFRYPALAIAAQVFAVVGLGVARGALDEVVAMAGERRSITGAPRLADRAHVQMQLARAEAQLRSACAFLYETTDQAYDRLVAGDELDLQTRTLLRLGATHAAQVGAEVARAAYAMCGAEAIFTNHPLAQALQDAIVVPQHAFLAEGTWQSAGRLLLGLEASPGFP